MVGLAYLDWRRRVALKVGGGYGDAATLVNEPVAFTGGRVANKLFTTWIPRYYGETHAFDPAVIGDAAPIVQQVASVTAIWAVEGALLVGILTVLAFAWKPVMTTFAEGTKTAIGGALLAAMNTASECGFGAVIAALPGFLIVANTLSTIDDPLINEAITVTALAGITGSASGGMSIALAAMADTFIANAIAAGIPMEVLHRVAAMASGSSARVDSRDRLLDGRRVCRPDQPRDFFPVAQEHQRRPQLDPKGAAKAAARAVLDLEVADVGMVGERARDQRLGADAVAAPGGAEFDHGGARHRVDFGARRLDGGVVAFDGRALRFAVCGSA